MKRKWILDRRNRFYYRAASLLFCLTFLCLGLALTGCGASAGLPTAPSTSPAADLPPTGTPHPSATATSTRFPTARPSATATTWPTEGPAPTSTLLVPTPVAQQAYRLTDWTVEKASRLIAELKNYPETLSPHDRWMMDSGYYSSFRYAGLAELEGVLHFPDAGPVSYWKFDGVYNQYVGSGDDVESLYTDLFVNALNNHETTLQEFETWFSQHFPFQLTVYTNPPPHGYQCSVVLYVANKERSNFTGGFVIWLLQKDGRFLGYPLKNYLAVTYGSGASAAEMIDLTGDGIAEAIIQNVDWGSFRYHDGDLSIYRLDQVPPQSITWSTVPESIEIATWSVDVSVSPPRITFQIQVEDMITLPCYNLTPGWQFQWDNSQLRFIRFIPPSMEEMEKSPICTRIMIRELGHDQFLQNPETLQTYTRLLELPFITKFDDCAPGHDEFLLIEEERLDLAMFLSDKGDAAGAAEQIALIRASTDPDVAAWRRDALAYYAARKDPQALMRLCQTAENCYLDLPERIALVPPGRFAEMETILQQMGVSIRASGKYDFDLDGQDEIWLIPADNIYFWILDQEKGQIFSRTIVHYSVWPPFVLEEGERFRITSLEPVAGVLRYRFTIKWDGYDSNSEFLYWPPDQKDPSVSFEQTYQTNFEIQNRLLLGQISPSEAQARLTEVLNSTVEPAHWLPTVQRHALYLLGLSQELNGDSVQAAQTYLKLWQTYPDSPYAIMAFAKLEPVP